jgi:Spy/CpxP family protein refolding chaperone
MKGLTAALLVSAALNIALISFMAGRLAGGAPPRPEGPSGPARILEKATPEVRAMLREAFVASRNEIAPKRRNVGELRLAMRDAILAEPFDRARVEAAYGAFRAAEQDLQSAHGAIVIDVLEKLPLEERKALVHALTPPGLHRLPRRFRHGGTPHVASPHDAPPADAPKD